LAEETTTLTGLNSFWSSLSARQDYDSGEALKDFEANLTDAYSIQLVTVVRKNRGLYDRQK
jgi:hypothetical protein